MARRSQFEYLKPEVFELFRQGKTASEVLKIYSDLSTSTVYDWQKQFRIIRNDSANKTQMQKQQGQQAIANSTSPQGNLLHLIPDCDDDPEDDRLSDIAWAKKEIKKHVRRPNRDSAVVVQALNAFLRAIQIERSLPADEPDDPDLQSARTARIAQLLDQGRDRRDRSSSQVERSG